MKRNRGGERDLDHIILAAIHGAEKAMLAYPIRVGIILMFDRTFILDLNGIIAKKAIKYAPRGIIGIDLAGPISEKFNLESLVPLVSDCKKAGLGITIHSGEATGADEVKKVIDLLAPSRIGHGVRSTEDVEVLKELSRRNIVLEVCPTSNIHTGVVKSYEDFQKIFARLKEYKVPFTINTDGPEMLKTNLHQEYQTLLDKKILTMEDIIKAGETAKKASFIKTDLL